MRPLPPLITALALAATLAGCATADNDVSRPRNDKEFLTGSNLPRKDAAMSNVRVVGKEAVQDLTDRSSASTPATPR